MSTSMIRVGDSQLFVSSEGVIAATISGIVTVTGLSPGTAVISGPVEISTVSGTVFVAISGDVTVCGTVNTIPSGIQTVSGLVQVDFQRPNSSAYSQLPIGFNLVSNNTVVSGVAGQTIRVFGLLINSACQTTLQFRDGQTQLTSGMRFAANGFLQLNPMGQPWFVCSTTLGFRINSSASGAVGGAVWYTQS